MSGVKGRSGRKSKRDEAKRQEIIEKAWDLVKETLDSDNKDKYQLARDIILRDITTNVDLKGDIKTEEKIILGIPKERQDDIGNNIKTVSI